MRALAALAAVCIALPAAAQDRSPAGRQSLTDLAHVLGQSHALRQACEGAGDQFWRSRMLSLLEVEAPDARLKARISGSFNAGFAAAQASFPVCTDAARTQARRLAGRGRALSIALAGPYR